MKRVLIAAVVLWSSTAWAAKFDCEQLTCSAEIHAAKKKPTYCGKTSTTYDGSQGGYTGANAKCASAFSGCHLCTAQDIADLIDAGTQPALGDGWMWFGPPGYQTFITSDCSGLTTNANPGYYGRQWRFGVNATGGRGTLATCNSHLPDHCCK